MASAVASTMPPAAAIRRITEEDHEEIQNAAADVEPQPPQPPKSRSPSPRILQKAASICSTPKSLAIGNGSKPSSSNASKRKGHLFPCPMVKTLDLDSLEGSPSSLGIVSGLNYYSVPFASSTSFTLACQQQRRRRGIPKRAKSVQSPTGTGSARLFPSGISGAGRAAWPQRQASLPIPEINESSSNNRSPSISPRYLDSNAMGTPSSLRISPASRSPQARALRPARSMHAQTHKLKRQVTICEDSVSIPDSQLFLSRQASVADSACLGGSVQQLSQAPSPQLQPSTPKVSPKPSPNRQQTILPRQESSFTQEEINR